MSKLYKIAVESDLMVIDITFNGKRHKFNLAEELKIPESRLQDRLKQHSTSYSFLTQLLTHLEMHVEELERVNKRIYSKYYVKYKTLQTGGRPLSDDLCKSKVEISKDYQNTLKNLIQAKRDKNKILRAVKSYEVRKDLMQTLSANLRNEK